MFNKFIDKFRRNENGTASMVVAVSMPVIIGALAVSIEAAYWMKSKKDLQVTVDLAAYAGMLEYLQEDEVSAVTAAKLDAMNNGFDFSRGSISVNFPPSSGSYVGMDALEVVISQKGNQYFSGIFGDDLINYNVRAVSALDGGDAACILTLDPSAATSFKNAGGEYIP
jgi:hypothetical protein